MNIRDVKLSFPNNSIKKFTLWIFTLYVTILTSFQENDPDTNKTNKALRKLSASKTWLSYKYETMALSSAWKDEKWPLSVRPALHQVSKATLGKPLGYGAERMRAF